jgi:hypothetical protein
MLGEPVVTTAAIVAGGLSSSESPVLTGFNVVRLLADEWNAPLGEAKLSVTSAPEEADAAAGASLVSHDTLSGEIAFTARTGCPLRRRAYSERIS